MHKTMLHLAAIGAAVLVLTGCSVRRAQEKYREVVSGVPEGRQLDLNSAHEKELSKLPGITDEDAARIVANRPYDTKRDLLRKNVLGERKYEQMADYVYVSEARRRGRRYDDQN